MGKKSRRRPKHKHASQPAAPPSPSPLSSPSDESTQAHIDADADSNAAATPENQVTGSRSQGSEPVPRRTGPCSGKSAEKDIEGGEQQHLDRTVDIDAETLRDGLNDIGRSQFDTPAARKVRVLYPLLRLPEDFWRWSWKLLCAYVDGGVTATPDIFTEQDFAAALAEVDYGLADEDIKTFRATFLQQRVPPRPTSASALRLPWAVHIIYNYIDRCS